MLDMEVWMEQFLRALAQTFAKRVWFVGLQGSRARDEANDASDIDVVVVLDVLTADDIAAYSVMLDTLPERALVCGFLSGKEELLHWAPSDLFQFCHDTKAYLGSLDEVLAHVDAKAIDEAIHLGACNVYHACVHNMVHEKSEEIMRALYKAACFVVQAICFRQSGRFAQNRTELLQLAASREQEIVKMAQAQKRGEAFDFDEASRKLFTWAQKWVTEKR